MMRRTRVIVAYDGAGFHGSAEQDGRRTVIGELRAAIEKIVRRPVALVGAGRTDAGVHGWGQVVSADLPADTDLADLQRRVNSICAPAITVRDWLFTADPEFDARYSATYRHYRYDVLNSAVPHPLVAPTTWHVPQPLRLWVMKLACDPLIGVHDFSSFCRRPKVAEGQPPVSLVRKVITADWVEVPGDIPGLLRFEIRGTAFCHQMVRSIVGTLVDVGLGKLHAGDVRAIMLSRDRQGASHVAPPHGLTLWEVGYPDGSVREA